MSGTASARCRHGGRISGQPRDHGGDMRGSRTRAQSRLALEVSMCALSAGLCSRRLGAAGRGAPTGSARSRVRHRGVGVSAGAGRGCGDAGAAVSPVRAADADGIALRKVRCARGDVGFAGACADRVRLALATAARAGARARRRPMPAVRPAGAAGRPHHPARGRRDGPSRQPPRGVRAVPSHRDEELAKTEGDLKSLEALAGARPPTQNRARPSSPCPWPASPLQPRPTRR